MKFECELAFSATFFSARSCWESDPTLAEREADQTQEEASYIVHVNGGFPDPDLVKGSTIGRVSWIPRGAGVLSCPNW